MTDNERLEGLADLFEDISNDMMPPYVGITCDTVVDVKWVIKYAKEQADRTNMLVHENMEIRKGYQERSKRVHELEEANKKNYWIASDFKFENLKLEEQNKRYREAREIIEQVYKDNYVKDAYGYEDGYLDGLDTAMSVIDKALEESE